MPNKKEFIRLEVRKIDSAIKSIKGKTSVLAKSKKSINNRKLLQNFLINEIGILNNYTVNYFNQLWSNEDIIFRAAIAIGSYIYPVRDSMPNNSYDKLVNTLENLVNLCGDCQDIHGDTKLLVALHLQNALSTLKIKEPLGISERKNKKIKEKKLIEKLIEILLNNGGIAFNGNEIVHYVEGGNALAISKGIMESNNELRRGVIDGVAGGNIDFYDTHDENNESINKSPSEFEIFINKPHLKKVTEYKGKSVAVLVDKNLRIKYIEMVSKLQVEEDIKRIVFHDDISKILENSHENSEADKEKLNKLKFPTFFELKY